MVGSQYFVYVAWLRKEGFSPFYIVGKIFSKLFLRYECLKKFNTGCLEHGIMLMREWLGNGLRDGSNRL